MKQPVISFAASVFLVLWWVAGLIFPVMQLSPAVLVVIVLINLPWIATIIESLELPGGFKIRFRSKDAEGPEPPQLKP